MAANLTTDGNEENLIIVQWNSNSIYRKLTRFKQFLYELQPHICCISETWLKHDKEPTFTNYQVCYAHRLNKTGGGLAILIRKDINFLPIEVKTFTGGNLEIQAITLLSQPRKIDILNVYNPNKDVKKSEFTHYFSQFKNQVIILGDFNAHHSWWGNVTKNNQSGMNLCDAIYNFPDLTLLTPKGLPTYYHAQTQKSSTLDLCFASSCLKGITSVEIIDCDIGSDHEAIKIRLCFKPMLQKTKSRPKWKFSEEKWDNWRRNLPELNAIEDLDSSYNELKTNLIITSKNTFGQTKGEYNPKYNKPWWNEECARVVGLKLEAKKKLKRHPSEENLIGFRKAEALVRRTVKIAKKDSFEKYCTTINSFSPICQVWKRVNSFSNNKEKQNKSPLVNNGTIITDPKDKSKILADHFEESLNVDHSELQGSINETYSTSEQENNSDYNQDFTMFELNNVLKSLKNTSHGHDQVHNLMLKNMRNDYKKRALQIINLSFEHAEIPTEWKKAIIIPIPKPDKPKDSVKSFRPISLLPCFAKLIEKLVKERLVYYLEKNDIFSPSQAGFRRRVSTQDQLLRLENTIRSSLAGKKICVVVFFDLSAAYDRVWQQGLFYKLAKMGVKGKMLKWIIKYIEERAFSIYYEGEYSTWRKICSSVPQGSILAPILFILMISDFPFSNEVHKSEFADDLAIYYSANNLEEVTEKVQNQITKIEAWAKKWGFLINIQKTKGMCFTRKRINTPVLTYKNEQIEFVKEHKFLGVVFDAPTNKWSKHVEHVKKSCLTRINLLKTISNKSWGADRVLLIRLYIVLVRSKIDYGALLYTTANSQTLNKMNVIQNSCLRVILGALKTTPIISMEVESYLPPLEFHWKMLLANQLHKLMELPNNVSSKQELISLQRNPLEGTRTGDNEIAPMVVRARWILRNIGFSEPKDNPTSLIGPIPPWIDLSFFIRTAFSSTPVGELPEGIAQKIFKAVREENYVGYREIYTDGSKITYPNGEESTAAGMVVFNEKGKMFEKWKLPAQFSIMSAELYAIHEALKFIETKLVAKKTVVYTDSLSSLLLLLNNKSKKYLPTCYQVQELILKLNMCNKVVLQYIPGHKGIEGNELADLAAKAAHNNMGTKDVPIPREDAKIYIGKLIVVDWQIYWENQMAITGKGLHLKQIKKTITNWKWSGNKNRRIETAMARLRMGHVRLQKHLYRFNLVENELCQCGEDEESVEHYLLQCNKYCDNRIEMLCALIYLDVEPTLQNLLGGGNFVLETQNKITQLVSKYLEDTGKLRTL